MANRFARNLEEKERVTLVALEGPAGQLIAHYNPKEIQIDKTLKWETFRVANAGEAFLTFGGAEGRTVTMELMLDCFEDKGADLDRELETLAEMSVVLEDAGDPHKIRPPLLAVVNGPITDYKCVLESLSVKVLMFGRMGKPVRATANVKLKEARMTRHGMLGAAARTTAMVQYKGTDKGMTYDDGSSVYTTDRNGDVKSKKARKS